VANARVGREEQLDDVRIVREQQADEAADFIIDLVVFLIADLIDIFEASEEGWWRDEDAAQIEVRAFVMGAEGAAAADGFKEKQVGLADAVEGELAFVDRLPVGCFWPQAPAVQDLVERLAWVGVVRLGVQGGSDTGKVFFDEGIERHLSAGGFVFAGVGFPGDEFADGRGDFIGRGRDEFDEGNGRRCAMCEHEAGGEQGAEAVEVAFCGGGFCGELVAVELTGKSSVVVAEAFA